MFWVGFVTGWLIGIGNYLVYRRTISRIGDAGGSECINGKWYRIEREGKRWES